MIIQDGWQIAIDNTPHIDVHTNEIVLPSTYRCIKCGYETGTQAKKFKYCPICGDKKGK